MPDALPFDFHFLRPLWLTALIPVAIIVLLVIRRQRPEAQWGDRPIFLSICSSSPTGAGASIRFIWSRRVWS